MCTCSLYLRILWTLFNLLASPCFVCYSGFQPAFERHVLVELNEILVRAAGAGHKPQQHLLSVWQLAQIHLRKLKIMSSLVFKDDLQPDKIDQSINQLFLLNTSYRVKFYTSAQLKNKYEKRIYVTCGCGKNKKMCMITKVAISFQATGSYHHVKLNSEMKIHYRGIHYWKYIEQ